MSYSRLLLLLLSLLHLLWFVHCHCDCIYGYVDVVGLSLSWLVLVLVLVCDSGITLSFLCLLSVTVTRIVFSDISVAGATGFLSVDNKGAPRSVTINVRT